MDGTHRVAILKCASCFYSTTNSVHLERHKEDFHGQDANASAEVATEAAKEDRGNLSDLFIPSQRSPVPCKDYSKVANSGVPKVTLETDMVTKDPNKIPSEAPEIELVETEMESSMNNDAKKCPDCDFTTGERYGITKHVRDVHGILGEAKCGLCKYEAEDDGFLLGLAKHIDNFHGNETY